MAPLAEIRVAFNLFNSCRLLSQNTTLALRTFASKAGSSSGGGSSKASSSGPAAPNVSGLSQNVVAVPSGAVGPGAAKDSDYKNPEYFCYNNTSYFEAEVEMLKYRCPQPSAKGPLKPAQ